MNMAPEPVPEPGAMLLGAAGHEEELLRSAVEVELLDGEAAAGADAGEPGQEVGVRLGIRSHSDPDRHWLSFPDLPGTSLTIGSGTASRAGHLSGGSVGRRYVFICGRLGFRLMDRLRGGSLAA